MAAAIKGGRDGLILIGVCRRTQQLTADYGNSKADFISKLHISLKETGESIYWLTLLKRTNLIVYDFDKLLSLAEEIKRMLIASLNTAKSSAEKNNF